MTIDFVHFTPWMSLAGGMLRPSPGDTAWRVLFLLGLVLAPLVWSALRPLPELHIDAGKGMLVAAGLLVGIGTRYGAGCTSGHGVCGMARSSKRSIVATCTFVAVGFVTVWLVRHVLA